MKKNYNLKLLIVLVFFVFVLTVFFALRVPELTSNNKKGKDRPEFAFEKVKIAMWEVGEPVWEIKADYAEVDTDKEYATLYNLKGEFLDNTRKIMYMESPTANLNLENSEIKVQKARIETFLYNKKANISAQTVIWSPNRKNIEAFGSIQINYEDLFITGEYLFADLTKNILQIKEKSRVKVNVKRERD